MTTTPWTGWEYKWLILYLNDYPELGAEVAKEDVALKALNDEGRLGWEFTGYSVQRPYAIGVFLLKRPLV